MNLLLSSPCERMTDPGLLTEPAGCVPFMRGITSNTRIFPVGEANGEMERSFRGIFFSLFRLHIDA